MPDISLSGAELFSRYRKTLNRIGWTLVIMLAMMTTFRLSLPQIDQLISNQVWNAAATVINGLFAAVSYIAYFVVPACLFYAMAHGEKTERIRFEPRLPATAPLMILAGLAVITAAARVNAWMCSLIGYSLPDDFLNAGESYDNAAVIVMHMTVALAPAVAEEILFRGVIYGNLRPFGRTQAVLVSSLLFALMHQNIGQFLYTFVGGIAMALMYEATGSIWCSTLFHMLNNGNAVIQEALYGRYGEAVGAFFLAGETVVYALGVLSLLLLLLCAQRRRERRETLLEQGIFGRELPPEQGTGIPFSAAIRMWKTPGIAVFSIVSLVSAVSLYVVVCLLQLIQKVIPIIFPGGLFHAALL